MDRPRLRKLKFLRTQYTSRELDARLGLSPKSPGRIVRLWLSGARNPSAHHLEEIDKIFEQSGGLVDVIAYGKGMSPDDISYTVAPAMDEAIQMSFLECVDFINVWIDNPRTESSRLWFDLRSHAPHRSMKAADKLYRGQGYYYVQLLDIRSSVSVVRNIVAYIMSSSPDISQLAEWMLKLRTWPGPGAELMRDRRLISYLTKWIGGETVDLR